MVKLTEFSSPALIRVDGESSPRIAELVWDAEGWPVFWTQSQVVDQPDPSNLEIQQSPVPISDRGWYRIEGQLIDGRHVLAEHALFDRVAKFGHERDGQGKFVSNLVLVSEHPISEDYLSTVSAIEFPLLGGEWAFGAKRLPSQLSGDRELFSDEGHLPQGWPLGDAGTVDVVEHVESNPKSFWSIDAHKSICVRIKPTQPPKSLQDLVSLARRFSLVVQLVTNVAVEHGPVRIDRDLVFPSEHDHLLGRFLEPMRSLDDPHPVLSQYGTFQRIATPESLRKMFSELDNFDELCFRARLSCDAKPELTDFGFIEVCSLLDDLTKKLFSNVNDDFDQNKLIEFVTQKVCESTEFDHSHEKFIRDRLSQSRGKGLKRRLDEFIKLVSDQTGYDALKFLRGSGAQQITDLRHEMSHSGRIDASGNDAKDILRINSTVALREALRLYLLDLSGADARTVASSSPFQQDLLHGMVHSVLRLD